MGKRFKGLKRLGAFVLSVVMAASMAVTVAPEMRAQAAGYEKLQKNTAQEENAIWRFSDGITDASRGGRDKFIVKSHNPILDEHDNRIGYHYVLMLSEGYEWRTSSTSSTLYDLWIDVDVLPKNSTDVATWTGIMNDWGSYTGVDFQGGSNILKFESGFSDYSLDMDFWLCKHDTTTKETDVPFIVGPIWFGTGECFEIWSNDEHYYTNVPKGNLSYKNTSSNGWEGFGATTSSFDTSTTYVTGLGRGADGVARLRYYGDGPGRLELRFGYQGYRISYSGDGNINNATLPTPEDRPASGDNINYYHPTKSTSTISANPGYSVKKYTIKRLYIGEGSTEESVASGTKVTFVGKDGTTKSIGVDDEILEEDIPFFNVIYSTEIMVHSVADIAKVELNYFYKNSAIGEDSATPNTKSVYASNETTSNHSYVPGAIVPGKDGKNYKLVGWFDTDGKEYKFGEPITTDTDIFAKWEEVVEDSKPSSTPEGSSSDSDTPSTGEPIKVEFVTPIGNPPPTQIKHVGDKADDPGAPIDPATLKPGTIIDGHRFEGWYLDKGFTMPYNFDTKLPHSIVLYAKWVRVSPKTGDTTIPAVYYVFGALALAGVGALAAKSRKLRK